MNLSDAFPIPYAVWYAARLYIEAGVAAGDVLGRLRIVQADWNACQERYRQLHFADTGWVAYAFERAGLSAPEDDRDLYQLLTGSPAPALFGMREALAAIRRRVEADPKIGPFAGVGWVAEYLCERHFPTIRYIYNGEQVCVDGKPLQTKAGKVIDRIDPTGFRKLGERWFTDGKRVYGQGETGTTRHWFVMRVADPLTFRVLNERYGADKDAGYYITNLRLSGGDPESFEVIAYPYGTPPKLHVTQSHYAKDSHKVYGYGVEIDGADASSFMPLGVEGKYFADKDRIYWERSQIQGADRASFTCAIEVGQYCAFDKDRVYYGGKVMSAATERADWEAYFKERPEITTTWWHEQAEAGDRNPIGGPFFSDGQRLWVRPQNTRREDWVSLDYIDHDSFEHVVDVFGIDRSGLRYVEPRLEIYERPAVKGADPASFERLGDGWYRCAKQAYFMNLTDPRDYHRLIVVKAGMDSFRVLGSVYAMDTKGLIVEGVRKRDIDAAAVEPIGGMFARLGDTVLFRGKVVKKTGGLDLTTARSPSPRLLIDGAGHMLLGSRYRKPVAGMNAAALRFITPYFATDERQLYVLTDDSLMHCEGAEVGALKIEDDRHVRDTTTRFVFGGRGLQREAIG